MELIYILILAPTQVVKPTRITKGSVKLKRTKQTDGFQNSEISNKKYFWILQFTLFSDNYRWTRKNVAYGVYERIKDENWRCMWSSTNLKRIFKYNKRQLSEKVIKYISNKRSFPLTLLPQAGRPIHCHNPE